MRRQASSKLTPTPDAVAVRLLALLAADPLALHNRAELARRLTPGERSGLDAALARLEGRREMLVLRRGKSVFYVIAGTLRTWLEGGKPGVGTKAPETLDEAYRRLVRESGGFPDVKIAALRAAGTGEDVAAELVARWRRGEATLSLGDWSLADEETRAAAVELHGEKYLLVRLEEAG